MPQSQCQRLWSYRQGPVIPHPEEEVRIHRSKGLQDQIRDCEARQGRPEELKGSIQHSYRQGFYFPPAGQVVFSNPKGLTLSFADMKVGQSDENKLEEFQTREHRK